MPGHSVKVGIYVSELDVKGGTHKQVLRLAQHLIARQHDVQIITARHVPGQGYPEFSDLPVLTLPQQAGAGLIGKLRRGVHPIRLACMMGKFDIVNVHDNRGLLFGLAAKALGKGRKYVWQINDLDPAFKTGAHREQQHATARERLQRIANRWWARTADAITVNVGKNRERVRECLSQDAQVLFCGVDFPAADFPAQRAGGAFRLLTTGVFFPYRNYETLLHACALANKSLAAPIELTIVGDTRYNPEYVDLVRQTAKTTGVSLTIRENLSQQELDRQISDSHAFAFVNVDQSWGLSVFEAAARTTPVILSRSVGASELLGGKPGFLMVDPLSPQDIAAAILSLATDDARLLATAQQAHDTVQDMSWERLYCAPALTLFERLLKS